MRLSFKFDTRFEFITSPMLSRGYFGRRSVPLARISAQPFLLSRTWPRRLSEMSTRNVQFVQFALLNLPMHLPPLSLSLSRRNPAPSLPTFPRSRSPRQYDAVFPVTCDPRRRTSRKHHAARYLRSRAREFRGPAHTTVSYGPRLHVPRRHDIIRERMLAPRNRASARS